MSTIVEKIKSNWSNVESLMKTGLSLDEAKIEVLKKQKRKFLDTDNICFGVKYKFAKDIPNVSSSTCDMDCPLGLNACEGLEVKQILEILN